MVKNITLEHIRFKNRQALKTEIRSSQEIVPALRSFGLGADRPVIVIVGGAGGVRAKDWAAIRAATATIAATAHQLGAAIIDGGTDAGVMAVSGQIRAASNFSFPLIGVAAAGTVHWPGREPGLLHKIFRDKGRADLEPNHTHFMLVPGHHWGDESAWIAEVASQLAGKQPSLAILINGGAISHEMDVPNQLKAGRAVFIIEGTGRAADTYAANPPNSDLMHFIHVNDLERLEIELKKHLQKTA
jgi:hypothetical protein